MRHQKGLRKFNRTSAHRVAMFRNLVTALLRHEQITTTEMKAKELRPIVEKVITLSRRNADETGPTSPSKLHAIRMARRWVTDRDVLRRLFAEIGVRYKDRDGGYTRIIKLGFRAGDNTPMSLIQLIPADMVDAPAPAVEETNLESAS